jgi:hypothetical protein
VNLDADIALIQKNKKKIIKRKVLKSKQTNRLINEKSPYLLQHAYNPVDWYPWGEEAFQNATEEDKPIFLSIGYSTCHWCHVMEHESFEDEEVAKLMNDAFVCIKVDREERPDIDSIYMSICQALTGAGGWPLTVIMTPDKKPFFTGTYFPKESNYGRVGMLELIPRIKELWLTKKEDLLQSAEDITESVKQSVQSHLGDDLSVDVLSKAFKQFSERFDEEYGGFGSSPKFPSPHNLTFLLRYFLRTKEEKPLRMVIKTLFAMKRGGIYDQVGFGFHRYSTDRQWLLPHFEKMLYDQAMLAIAYTEAYQLTQDPFLKETVYEILSYVQRDLTDSNGGFYSAEDADSEGEEGKFYLWRKDEIKEILVNEHELFCDIFSIKDEGNFVDPFKGGTLTGENILHLTISLEEFAEKNEIDFETLQEFVTLAKEKLFIVRKERVHPHKDDKILVDWNGLMITAFAKAGAIFNEDSFIQSAEKSAAFILEKMKGENYSLLHRYRDGEAAFDGTAEDYSFFIWGLIELYQATFNVSFLNEAIKFQEYFDKHFLDEEYGGYFINSDLGEELIVRKKDLYDGAIPSSNSIAFLNLIQLSRLTGKSYYENRTRMLERTFSDEVNIMASAYTQFLSSVDYLRSKSFEIVIVEGNDKSESKKLIDAINSMFIPYKVVLVKNEDSEKTLDEIAPFTKNMRSVDGKTTVYVCVDYSCSLPVNTVEEMVRLLQD